MGQSSPSNSFFPSYVIPLFPFLISEDFEFVISVSPERNPKALETNRGTSYLICIYFLSPFSLTQLRRKEDVFPEEMKDLEGKTSSFGYFLDYLFPDKNACQRKGSCPGSWSSSSRKDTGMARWQDFSSRKLTLQITVSHVFPSHLFSASKFPRSSDLTAPTISE